MTTSKWLTPRNAIISLAVTYLVGLIGFIMAPHIFQRLTPINLIYSALLVFLFHRNWSRGFIVFAIIIALTGFAIERAGVYTGQIFGQYAYGSALGYKLLDVPLLIALNWLLLIYCTGTSSGLAKIAWWKQAILGAVLMVTMDVLIEPFAIQYGLWQWMGGHIPMQNYLAWFIVSLALLMPFHYYRFAEKNLVAVALYLIQLVFFGILLLL
jgi:uncharacterized membrane protein